MSVESALAYIHRMRADEAFRQEMNAISDDEDAAWERIRAAGYEFTMIEFKAAQEKVYEEYGLTPH
jgi:predicted ribosomally synthesized peptide with nif11-like leader